MAVLPIVITGDPVLHTPAGPVKDFNDELRSLVDDMFETMDAAPGVGLAAPQVGVPLRVFVYGWVDDDDVEYRGVAINPELWLSPLSTAPLHDMAEAEGCLSVPGERYPLRRAHRIILRALDLDGQPYEITADGWLARIFQHEYDHLDGVLYVDRLDHANGKAAAKAVKRAGWGTPGLTWMPGVDDLEG
ncbi:peptide deformylase [Salinibacterium sp. dk2585]|uniref:peptide deformylase n=1 Tax=unclassified Salinibacterium TaxID=2632331 RepID=UPI0011C253D7|nr:MULTISPECIES: peptide deformylase [unclassified Salinibacterium]QEE61374.1 peptide deformylase [Salinibacterium sp. dk2585]TXK54051.1 peptide deformylase [Salinibacterium sp. dk5596]